MSADETIVDILSLRDFHGTLQSRIDEVGRAQLALITSPGSEPPALGGFHDAGQTAARHQVLHDQYVERLGRLLNALTAVQAATARIIDSYRTVEELNSVRGSDIKDALRPVGEALDGGAANA